MKKLFTLFTVFVLFAFTQVAWGQTYPTRLTGTVGQSNEERLIRVEEGVKHLDKRIDGLEISLNKRFDDMNKRFDALQGFMLWGFGITFSGMFILMGFILWDRRTTLAPVVREQKYLQAEIDEWKKKEKTIIEVLNKYAEGDPKLKELLNKSTWR